MARELALVSLDVSMQESHMHRISFTSAADANDRSIVLLPYMGKQQKPSRVKEKRRPPGPTYGNESTIAAPAADDSAPDRNIPQAQC